MDPVAQVAVALSKREFRTGACCFKGLELTRACIEPMVLSVVNIHASEAADRQQAGIFAECSVLIKARRMEC